MRVMVLLKSSDETESGTPPSEAVLTEMGKYNEQLVKAGVMLTGEGLRPSSQGRRVRFQGKQSTVVDGPFAETKELIAGYWIWEVASLEEAVEWLKRSPFEDAEVEIRRVYEAEDFGEAFTPELREREQQMRDEVASRRR
jgi:hypothetical protein